MPTRDVELQRVNPGEEIKAAAQNLVIEAIEKRPTEAQVNQIVTDKLAALIGAAPEHLDTLEEIAAEIANKSGAMDALNAAITAKANKTDMEVALGLKADKVQLDGKVNITTFNEAMKTSDKFNTMSWDAVTEELTITFKDGTKKNAQIVTTAVYG